MLADTQGSSDVLADTQGSSDHLAVTQGSCLILGVPLMCWLILGVPLMCWLLLGAPLISWLILGAPGCYYWLILGQDAPPFPGLCLLGVQSLPLPPQAWRTNEEQPSPSWRTAFLGRGRARPRKMSPLASQCQWEGTGRLNRLMSTTMKKCLSQEVVRILSIF